MSEKSKKNEGKLKEAAALQYEPDRDSAPRILAIGRGEVAERIIETAKENEVPIYEDAPLAHTLNQLNLGDYIPPELYELAAEILVFVGNLDRDYGEKHGRKQK